MSINLSSVITDLSVDETDRKKVESLWDDFFSRFRGTDDDYVLSEKLVIIEGRIIAILDSTENGRKFFGQTASAIYIQRKNLPEEVLDKATFDKEGLIVFVGLVKKIHADVRQAFNDYSSELGVQGN